MNNTPGSRRPLAGSLLFLSAVLGLLLAAALPHLATADVYANSGAAPATFNGLNGHPRISPLHAGLVPNGKKPAVPQCPYTWNLSSKALPSPPPVALTSYWIAIEGSYDMNDDGDTVLLSGIKNLTIPECDNAGRTKASSTLGKTDRMTLTKCHLEGTCHLLSGLTINLGNAGSGAAQKSNGIPAGACFVKLPPYAPYGFGSQENALQPWVSIAVNNLKFGTVLYAPVLKGFEIPGTENAKGIRMKHNGCLRVDDIGWSLGACHVDFFVYSYVNWNSAARNLPERIFTQLSNATACPLLRYPVKAIPTPIKTTRKARATTVRRS